MGHLHTETGHGQIIATEYGGIDQSELRSWTFEKVEDSQNQFILVHQSPKGHADAEYPVRNAPDNIVEIVEQQEDVEIVERETPIWSSECTECGWKSTTEADKDTEKVDQECPMCDEVTEFTVNTW